MGGALMVWYCMVLFDIMFWNFPTFISVKHLVILWAKRVLASAYIAMLCRKVRRLFMCLFVQHYSR